jgi:hypothetical protein
MKTLLATIENYDREQREYIRDLEVENERLRVKNRELVDQLARYVATVDRMKLNLIVSGALKRPAAQPELSGVTP